MGRPRSSWLPGLVAGLAIWAAGTALPAQEGLALSKGQTLYVPVYSHIYWGPKQRVFDLACTLSIRNVDPSEAITIVSVDYFNTEGKRIRSFLQKPLVVPPLGTKEYYIEEKDTAGGSGANFLVRWSAAGEVNPPIVECVMIGVQAAQGVSFTSRGRVILDHPREPAAPAKGAH